MASNDFNFRRRFPRRRLNSWVGVLYKGIYEVSKGREAGEGGIAFTTERELGMNELLVVSFQLQGGLFMTAQGTVRNKREVGSGQILYGCSFNSLRFEYKREIRLFVTARSAAEA